jgi:hypothetical protein
LKELKEIVRNKDFQENFKIDNDFEALYMRISICINLCFTLTKADMKKLTEGQLVTAVLQKSGFSG